MGKGQGHGMSMCVCVCTHIIPQASWVLPGQLFCLQQVPGTLTSWAEGRGSEDSAESQNPHL